MQFFLAFVSLLHLCVSERSSPCHFGRCGSPLVKIYLQGQQTVCGVKIELLLAARSRWPSARFLRTDSVTCVYTSIMELFLYKINSCSWSNSRWHRHFTFYNYVTVHDFSWSTLRYPVTIMLPRPTLCFQLQPPAILEVSRMMMYDVFQSQSTGKEKKLVAFLARDFISKVLRSNFTREKEILALFFLPLSF